jgi:hypothetical protein
MKRYAAAFATILGACAFATLALAQDTSTVTNGTAKNSNPTIVSEPGTANLNLDELRAFDQIAQSHPDMAKALARKPALIKSDKFVSKYPDLQAFLGKYPDARDNIHRNPGDYLTPVSGSAWKHAAPGIKMSAKDGSAADNDGGMSGMTKDSGSMNDSGAMKNSGSMKDGGSGSMNEGSMNKN